MVLIFIAILIGVILAMSKTPGKYKPEETNGGLDGIQEMARKHNWGPKIKPTGITKPSHWLSTHPDSDCWKMRETWSKK